MSSLFDTYAHYDPGVGESVLQQADFSKLLSSDLFQHNDLVYLSKIAQYASLDIFRILFIVSDLDNKGYIRREEFEKFTQQILLPRQQKNASTTSLTSSTTVSSSDLDTDINKLLFLICKLHENKTKGITTQKNRDIYNLNFTISQDSFLKLVEEYNRVDLPYMQNLLSQSQSLKESKNFDFQHFSSLVDELPKSKFQSAFKDLQTPNETITPTQLREIAQFVFYNKLTPSIADHFQSFAQHKYGNELNYQESLRLIQLLRNLPKLNFLTFEKLSSGDTKYYFTANSLYKYIQGLSASSKSNMNLGKVSSDDVLLYFNWNRYTYDHLRANPSIDPDELLAVLTDDLVTPVDLCIDTKATTNISSNHFFQSIHSFILGSMAGMIGATIVYPIDIVKTRMQNQKGTSVYSSYPNCFKTIIRNEGIFGLYSGLLPQIIGVAPEKAIKLTLNDIIRKIGAKNSPNGDITMPWEILAGSTAGMCQVAVTNPLEVTKIRMQTQGEMIGQMKPKSAFGIIMELGPKGLYRGAGACLLRDIPFSAIYFPAYANIKKRLFGLDPGKPGKRSSLEPYELLVSGALAGCPAAFLTTPCDVIKTRIQTKPKPGAIPYRGIFPAFKRICAEEGIRALFKGGVARVCRSSPQFGFTLAAYEMFQNTLPLSMFYEDTQKKKGASSSSSSSSSSDQTAFSISENSKRFKLSSSASAADLNPTLLSLTKYYKSLENDRNEEKKKN